MLDSANIFVFWFGKQLGLKDITKKILPFFQPCIQWKPSEEQFCTLWGNKNFLDIYDKFIYFLLLHASIIWSTEQQV